MGKKVVQKKQQPQKTTNSTQIAICTKAVANFSISQKSYVKFFQFLKELHASQGQEKQCQINSASSLIDITTSIMNFFNYEKTYSSKQLECSIICLANLFNVIGNNISKLHFQPEFVFKVRRFLSSLASGDDKNGFEQKIQAIFYILTILIYKQRIGQEKRLRELNKKIFKDRSITNSLLNIKLPVQKKIGKFYGIVIIYLTNNNVNNGLKKKIIKSILLNFCNLDHEQTLLNLLVYLRSEKNKVTISLKDIQEGKIFEILLNAYPRHIHQYQSYYILDYLHHLLQLFPIMAQEVANSQLLPYLVQNAGPENLYHPLHSSMIMDFISKTLNYLEPFQQRKLLHLILDVEIKQYNIIMKLIKVVFNLQDTAQNIYQLALKGYFDKLLGIIRRYPQECIRIPSIELYCAINQKLKTYNEAFSDLYAYRIQMTLELLHDERKQKYLQLLHSKMQSSTQLIL